MESSKKLLFNFSVSFSGGGYKRLYEYSKWFNGHGGACFIVHPNCRHLVSEFLNNQFFVVHQTKWQRLFNDCGYLSIIKEEIGQPDLYYSYGIPIYARFGKVNWFHLSNVLPLSMKSIPMTISDRFKLGYLGRLIKKNFHNADVISAESIYSIEGIGKKHGEKLFLSVNGGDDELAYIALKQATNKADFATAVGTYKYKAIEHALLVFEMLKRDHPQLKMNVIGNKATLPAEIHHRKDVFSLGLLKRPDVINCLRRSRYYISTTYIENSYNAASEGIFLADESYISDIGPHRELLEGSKFTRMALPGTDRTMLHVKRDELLGHNLKAWDEVISEMMSKFRETRGKTGGSCNDEFELSTPLGQRVH